MDPIARIDELVARLKAASWKERDAVKEELLAFCQGQDREVVTRHLEAARRDLVSLELRWELDEVLEALQPPPEPEPEPEPEEEAPAEEPPSDGRLRMSDLQQVYDDPRGLALYIDKKTQTRWFAVQPDPYTGQPGLMEVPPAQIEGVKAQLRGSPYWVLGSGVAPT